MKNREKKMAWFWFGMFVVALMACTHRVFELDYLHGGKIHGLHTKIRQGGLLKMYGVVLISVVMFGLLSVIPQSIMLIIYAHRPHLLAVKAKHEANGGWPKDEAKNEQ